MYYSNNLKASILTSNSSQFHMDIFFSTQTATYTALKKNNLILYARRITIIFASELTLIRHYLSIYLTHKLYVHAVINKPNMTAPMRCG